MRITDKSRATVVTTRPAGQAVNLCRALRRRGMLAWNLPLMRLRPVADECPACQGLASSLGGDAVIFTSPAAVRHALDLWPSDAGVRATRYAVGESTARALRRAGLGPILVPAEASSEGLLAMAPLADVDGRQIAIVGAAGGRPFLGDQLARRGAVISRVNVYRRVPAQWNRRHWRALESMREPLLVTVTSAQSMAELADRLPAADWQRLRAGTAVASSPRLAHLARDLGFAAVKQARSATDADLIAAIDTLF